MSAANRLAPLSFALALGLALASPSTRAAESYDNCTGFIEALPATISTQGVWCLKANLATAMNSGSAITIAANNVTLDCNDFKIGGLAAGNTTQAFGVFAESRLNVTVRNCGIRGFSRGIWMYGGAGGPGGGHLVEHNRLDQNYSFGILVHGDGNRVIDNRVFDTGGAPSPMDGSVTATAIAVDGDAVDNTVSNVYGLYANFIARGIVVNDIGSEARGNRVRNVLSAGTGFAYGIAVMTDNITVSGNRISNPTLAPASQGVYVDPGADNVFCISNTVAGYIANYLGCDHLAGNLPVAP